MKWFSQYCLNTDDYTPKTSLNPYEQHYKQLQKQIEQNEKELDKYYALIQLKRYVLNMHDIKDKKELQQLLDAVESAQILGE